MRAPARWLEFADLLLAYEPYAEMPEFRALVHAFHQATTSFNDPSQYFALLEPKIRRFWDDLYWSYSTTLPGVEAADEVYRLRVSLAETLTRLEIKGIIAEIAEGIDKFEQPLDVYRNKLMESFHRLVPREGIITWDEAPKVIEDYLVGRRVTRAFPFPFLKDVFNFDVDIFTGDISLLMGRTGRGKTTFAINVAKEFIAEGRIVCYISTEMSEDSILTKLLACITGKEWKYLYGRNQTQAVLEEALAELRAFQEQHNGKFFVLHKARCTVSDIAAAATYTRSLYGGLDLIIIDYIQQIESGLRRREDTRAYELAQIVSEIADIATYNSCAVIVVSQVNSQGEVKDARAIEERAGLAVRIGMKSDREFADEIMKSIGLGGKYTPPELMELFSAKFRHILDVEIKKNRYGAYDTKSRYLLIDPARCRVLGVWPEADFEAWKMFIAKKAKELLPPEEESTKPPKRKPKERKEERSARWIPPAIDEPLTDEDFDDPELRQGGDFPF